jgi:NHL repeat
MPSEQQHSAAKISPPVPLENRNHGVTMSKGIRAARIPMSLMSVVFAISCGGGGGTDLGGQLSGGGGGVTLSFTNGQAAAVVVGQTSFNLSDTGSDANSMNQPYGNVFVANGQLFVPDHVNDRVMVFSSVPTLNGANAAFALGQPNLTTVGGNGVSATALNNPTGLVIANGQLFVSEKGNNRVSIYNAVPTASPGTINVVLGQPNKTSQSVNCTSTGLSAPEGVWVAGGKVVVADSENHRVLIWNTLPTVDAQAANLVLGQGNSFTACTANQGGAASRFTLNRPSAVWTDGTRLVVVDTNNHRVLLWDTFPTISGQGPDRVLGQADFASAAANRGLVTAANTLNLPIGGAFVRNNQLFVTDSGNNRTLIWNTFPVTNGQAADNVIGQLNTANNGPATVSTRLDSPTGVAAFGSQLFVTDLLNHRVLIYND